MSFETIEIKMAAVSVKRSIDGLHLTSPRPFCCASFNAVKCNLIMQTLWAIFYCFVYQHGRLITWMQTKNSTLSIYLISVLNKEHHLEVLGNKLIQILTFITQSLEHDDAFCLGLNFNRPKLVYCTKESILSLMVPRAQTQVSASVGKLECEGW